MTDLEMGFFEVAGTRKRDHNSKINESEATVIISVVENRAREICISKMETNNISQLELFLMSDSHSYNEAIATIQAISPDEILLHDGSRSKVLSKKIEAEFANDSTRIVYISRQYFDQDRGADMLKKIIVGNVDADLIAKYTVLSGSYCLIRYIENCSGSVYAANSLKLMYTAANAARMVIDRGTASALELINNAKSGNQKDSLFGSINHTKTVVGARLLRSNILRPSTDLETINLRLDTVEAFRKSNAALVDVMQILQNFPDLDKILSGLVTSPKTITAKTARIAIDTVINLRQTIKMAATLSDCLKFVDQNQIIEAIIENCRAPVLQDILNDIDNLITESTIPAKSVKDMKYQECFALRNGLDGLLDVARKTFLQMVEDLHMLADRYSAEYDTTVKIGQTTTRGYYLIIPTKLKPLPEIFTQAIVNKSSIHCSTEEFTSIADRATMAINNALTLTHDLLQDLLAQTRNSMESLFILTDSIALLDMLCSFADVVSLSPHTFVRPVLQYEGPLVVKEGYHPVIVNMSIQQMKSSFVPNDFFMSPLDNMRIISGPNGSGKSVFVKQIALLVVLAQVGCFVPARQAIIPIRDRLLSRIGTSDDMEHNMSTFATEMKDVAYILSNITEKSIIIIDELGRGTSNIDGVSLAYAIAEELLNRKAMSMFVTHFPQITNLSSMYPNVQNIHLKTTINFREISDSQIARNRVIVGDHREDSNGVKSASIKFLHKINSGPCDMKTEYGIIIAEQCGLPDTVIRDAQQMRRKVRENCPVLLPQNKLVDNSLNELTRLLQHLLLLKNSTLDDEGLLNYLNNLRSQYSTETITEMLQTIDSLEMDESK